MAHVQILLYVALFLCDVQRLSMTDACQQGNVLIQCLCICSMMKANCTYNTLEILACAQSDHRRLVRFGGLFILHLPVHSILSPKQHRQVNRNADILSNILLYQADFWLLLVPVLRIKCIADFLKQIMNEAFSSKSLEHSQKHLVDSSRFLIFDFAGSFLRNDLRRLFFDNVDITMKCLSIHSVHLISYNIVIY